MPFEPVDPRQSFPELEERVLERCRERDIFNRSLANREGAEVWSSYEGPPTANGRPGSHDARPPRPPLHPPARLQPLPPPPPSAAPHPRPEQGALRLPRPAGRARGR